MPLNEFWYGDTRLLKVYQISYYRNKSYEAWLFGQCAFTAFSLAMKNAFAKRGTKPEQYPQWKDPMEKFDKPKFKIENIEDEFRKQQAEQNTWLFHK